ncbi:conserved hypothetical protein [delta proteobacterium NaphS2]|nr:conserved hypothetical protein [delta proteobacterium NaphS2]
MNYDETEWKKRYAERSDIGTQIVHLTREREGLGDSIDVLLKILNEKKLEGSTTESGFIVGSRRAVCFQDTPIISLCQNVYYEQTLRKQNNKTKVRYLPIGIAFQKGYAFKKGARPVIYDKTEDAKRYLPEDQWWRIVNFDLENAHRIIDWTHEREWRAPDYFGFSLSETLVVLSNTSAYRAFLKRVKAVDNGLLEKLSGIVVLQGIFR